VAVLRPWRFFCAGLTRIVSWTQAADPHLLGVPELLEHDLIERRERPLRIGFAQLRATGDRGNELRLG
jgi:hypothetical protein